MNRQDTDINRIFSIPLIFSIGASVLLLLTNIFRWYLVERLTVFLEPFLELFFGIVFIVIFIWSFIYLLKKYKSKGIRGGLPFVINIITVLLIIFIPFTDIVLKIDYKINFNERKSIVSMVESGELKENVEYNKQLILLPEKYRHLSKGGGEIIVEKDSNSSEILFYTFRGVLDNFSGFVYTTDGHEPSPQKYKQILKIDYNWYWCASW